MRSSNFLKRRKRFAKLVAAAGKKAYKVFSAGLKPGLTFGMEVTGCSDKLVELVRSTRAKAMQPYSGSASLSIKIALHGDPAESIMAPALLSFVKEVWEGTLGVQ